MPRKPKGHAHRYEIEYRLTKLNNGEEKYRWHARKFYGQERGPSTFGHITPCPGPDATNERLIAGAGFLAYRSASFLQGVTVPVYIIRNGVDADRMKAGLLEPVLLGFDEKAGKQREAKKL